MSAISKALEEVFYNIPIEILNLAFLDNNYSSLSDNIKIRVIDKKVIPDMNLTSYEELVIPLGGLKPIDINGWTVVYKIPPEMLKGREIIDVHRVVSMPLYIDDRYMLEYPMVEDITSRHLKMLANKSTIDSSAITTECDVISKNIVRIHKLNLLNKFHYMTVVVSNDPNLNNINIKHYLHFSKLVILAVKMYIHNKLIIMLDRGAIQNGHEVGTILDIVNEYGDTDKEYDEYYNKIWKQIAYMNSDEKVSDLVKLQLGMV